MERYNLAIIGGGPGGYAAALRASALGLSTVLVEKESLGGTCLNRGCIPTKTFVHCASLYQQIKKAREMGMITGNGGFLFGGVQLRKQQVVGELVTSLKKLLKNGGVNVLFGSARLISPQQLEVHLAGGETSSLKADKIIIATGSEELIPPVPGVGLPGIMTSREALDLTELPASLVVVGGGVVALELASVFASFEVEVTVVQRSRLLRREDTEMVRRLTPLLRRQGISILTETPLERVEQNGSGYSVHAKTPRGNEIIRAEKVLVAVGRKASFGGLNLAGLGIEHDEGGIIVKENMETTVAGVYAVGDVAAPGWFLAHVALYQGMVAAENAAGRRSIFREKVVPLCIFTRPELARAGFTEEEARQQGVKIKVGKFPFSANGKAFLQGEGEGTVKIIGDAQSGKVLGVHILGPHASDLIQEGTLAVAAGLSVSDLAEMLHPHPTLSEAIWEAALAFHQGSLHMAGR